MNWLFRFNIASERHGDQVVHGIGHAMRCISLAQEVEKRGDSALLSIEGEEDVEQFFEQKGIEYVRNSEHIEAAKNIDADVVVVDINYLDKERIQEYKTVAPVVNLAPRGVPKYYSDLTFTSERIRDVPEPDGAPSYEWLAGPEYTILNSDFVRERQRLKSEYGDVLQNQPTSDRVVIHMGGVDKSNRTGQVLDSLANEFIEQYRFTLVVGPFNPNVSEIRNLATSYGDNMTICNSPDNLANVFSGAKLAILGTGISTYEALAIGVPSANVGVSEFHDMRGQILEKESLGVYLGNQDDLKSGEMNLRLHEFLEYERDRNQIRKNGFNRIDGRATLRIVEETKTNALG